jgi:hypothetical protein
MKRSEQRSGRQESLTNGFLQTDVPTKKISKTKTKEDEWGQFLARFRKLRQDTYELHVSLSTLQKHTNSMECLSDSHKECILRICEVICKKHSELVYSEKLMKEVILQLHEDASF